MVEPIDSEVLVGKLEPNDTGSEVLLQQQFAEFIWIPNDVLFIQGEDMLVEEKG